MVSFKAYDETTAADFRRLFVERFPGGDPAILDVVLANPARPPSGATGLIAYDASGRVAAIQGWMPRTAYFGRTKLRVAAAIAMAVWKDADRAFFADFLRESVRSTGADLMLANTTVPGSRRRLQAAAGAQDGPASCALIRERALRANGRLARAFRKVLAAAGLRRVTAVPPAADEVVRSAGQLTIRRVTRIDAAAFDGFWRHYLASNAGLVTSRTAAELAWVFAAGLASGETVLLTAEREDVLVGYVFCRRTDETALCWRIADMIALGDEGDVLAALVEGASTFLRRRTPAAFLQVTGFPMRVQPLFARLFPQTADFGFNKFVWAWLNDGAAARCGDWITAAQGWFGGPFDGDMCFA